MKYNVFTDDDKIKYFDQITRFFYEANFGTLSKSAMELLMFHFYLEKLMARSTSDDGIIDYSQCSDYVISKDLGITQQRVRNLKVKNQLAYPIEFDWKAALARLTENARYDTATNRIALNIPDPNLYLEIQNFIESKGAYIEKQLNSKLLQLRAEYYIDLVVELEPEENRKKIIKSLRKMFQDNGKDDKAFREKEIGKSLLNGALNLVEVAANVSSFISSDNIVGTALLNLISGNNLNN